jgi:hypothetical protein
MEMKFPVMIIGVCYRNFDASLAATFVGFLRRQRATKSLASWRAASEPDYLADEIDRN